MPRQARGSAVLCPLLPLEQPVRALGRAGLGQPDAVGGVIGARAGDDAGPVADACLFLLSGLARGVTGEIVHVDGGYHALGAPLAPPAQAEAEVEAETADAPPA